MDDKNWRVVQAEAHPQGQIQRSSQVITGEVAPAQEVEAGDWRTQLQPGYREMIVNKMMDTLKSHLPFSGQKGLQELRKIAARFEEMYYTSATSQSDYLAKICLKMLTMETSQNPMPNSLQSIASESQGMQPQVQIQNQVQQLPPMPMVSHQTQVRPSSFNMPHHTNLQKQAVYQEQQPLQKRLLKRKLPQESDMQPFLPINLPIIDRQQQLNPQYISDFQNHQMVDIQHGSSGLQNYQKPAMPYQSMVTTLQQNPQQRDMHQGYQTSSTLLHQQTKSKIDQQIILQSQGVSEVPLNTSSHTGNTNDNYWQDEIFQQSISMDEMYFPELNEIFQGMSAKLPQENQVSSEIEPTNAQGSRGTTLQHDLTHNFSCLDDTDGMESTIASGNSNVVEQPLERLIKVVGEVKCMSQTALSGSVSDISSVVSMADKIAGSGPGNGSRAALGEDLVAMTKCHLKAQDGSNCTKKKTCYTSAVPSGQ